MGGPNLENAYCGLVVPIPLSYLVFLDYVWFFDTKRESPLGTSREGRKARAGGLVQSPGVLAQPGRRSNQGSFHLHVAPLLLPRE